MPRAGLRAAHLSEAHAVAVAQQVHERHAFGIKQLEGKPDPLGRILDPDEGVGDITEQVLASAKIAALVAERDAPEPVIDKLIDGLHKAGLEVRTTSNTQ
jgi:hypothetical protein